MKSLDCVNKADSWRSEGLILQDFHNVVLNIGYALCVMHDRYQLLVYFLHEVMHADLTKNIGHQS